jgi:hypothetical protein
MTLTENAEGLHANGKQSKEFKVLAIDGEEAEDYDDMPPLVELEDEMPPLVPTVKRT